MILRASFTPVIQNSPSFFSVIPSRINPPCVFEKALKDFQKSLGKLFAAALHSRWFFPEFS